MVTTPETPTAKIAKPWTRDDAIALCIEIESTCPQFGCHVALTGGCLYKEGPRKDCDILFYRIREIGDIDLDGLIAALDLMGVKFVEGWGWCYKFTYHGKPIDAFFPEEVFGPGYGGEEELLVEETAITGA